MFAKYIKMLIPTTLAVVLLGAVIAGPAAAQGSFSIGVGVGPYGNSFSIGVGSGYPYYSPYGYGYYSPYYYPYYSYPYAVPYYGRGYYSPYYNYGRGYYRGYDRDDWHRDWDDRGWGRGRHHRH